MTRSQITSSPLGGGALAQALAARSRRGEPRAYDFRRPTKLSREHVRLLQIAQEAFARHATTVLTSQLRTGARMDLQDIEQVGYDDYVSSLPNPTFIATFNLDPLPGKGMLAFPLEVAMASLDHMLGGSGSANQPSRPMTQMESLAIGSLLDRLLSEFGVAFAPISKIAPALNGLEYNPALAQTAAASETVMISRYSLRVGLREAEATLCLPFSSFAAALKTASSPSISDDDRRKREEATATLSRRIRDVSLDVAVRFSPVAVSSSDLTNLAVGDVIPLGHPKDAPLEVVTHDEIFAHAMSGNHRRRLAAQIVSTPLHNDKDHR